MGIYEAVEKYCPRDDPRRTSKPDGSWLPRVGEKYSGAISFWKPEGLRRYISSGLRTWHESVVPKVQTVKVSSDEINTLYEDEFQVIGNRKIPTELLQLVSSIHYTIPSLDSGVSQIKLGDIWKTRRAAVNLVKLAPNSRSSIPHAESSEEEFVFVLHGRPLVWLDGEAYQLEANHTVGFPAGTGLCHTFINDSADEVLLLVLGEKSKPDNKWIYPLSLELKEAQGQGWWTEWPVRKFRPHPGTPGTAIPPSSAQSHSAILHIRDLTSRGTFSYPNDSETFGMRSGISRKLGMKWLGISHEILAPSKRSSWPHAHSHEEEFVLILSGHPTVWMNGWIRTLNPGDIVFFWTTRGPYDHEQILREC